MASQVGSGSAAAGVWVLPGVAHCLPDLHAALPGEVVLAAQMVLLFFFPLFLISSSSSSCSFSSLLTSAWASW